MACISTGFEPVTQLAQCLTETLFHDTLTIGICGVPELPYQVLALDTGLHLAPPAAVLSTGVNTTATSWSVAASATDSTALFSTAGGGHGHRDERVELTADGDGHPVGERRRQVAPG